MRRESQCSDTVVSFENIQIQSVFSGIFCHKNEFIWIKTETLTKYVTLCKIIHNEVCD